MRRRPAFSGRSDGDQKGPSPETIQICPVGMTGDLQGNRMLYTFFFSPSQGKGRQWPEVGNHPPEWHCGDLSGFLSEGCHLLLEALFSAVRAEP